MKQLLKRSLACLLVLIMVVGMLPAISLTADAAGNTYNWGKRGETATELSDMAEAWYAKYNTSYDALSAYSGSSSIGSVPSSTLYSQLKTLMTNAHSYKTSYEATKSLYQYTDCQNGGGKISSFYSGTAIGPGWGEGGSWNREHVWPNSKGLGGQDENDIMMLRPTTTSENSSRGNEAFGKSASFYDPNGESGGKYNLHGDVARICLYVYVRWGNTSRMWGSSGVMESKDVLLEWMEEDPVDTWELGRNDAVQSITGTRNVFVDYPELAFDLFNAPVPDGYDSPSGGTPSYTITAQSNNTAYGTVSLSGKTITATPKTGYYVSGYKVTSGTATVTQSGNTFTVVASSNCTIQIQFSPRTQATVTFMDQGTSTTQTVYSGDSITLPNPTEQTPDGFVFRGWVMQTVSESETKPSECYAEGTAYTVNGNKTFYALYAKVEEGIGEAGYQLVTNASQLVEGSSVVIAAAGYNVAIGTTQNVNNRSQATITKSGNTITLGSGVAEFTLGSGINSGTYSFYCQTNKGYLAAAASGSSNRLYTNNSVDSAASFAITVNGDGSCNVVSQTSSANKNLQYNQSASLFACYTSGQKAVAIYVLSGTGDAYYTTDPVQCAHADTENVAAVAATCTAPGYTAGVYCNDCERYISGHEEVAATGHSWDAGKVTTEPTCTTTGVKTYTCSACGETKTESVSATGHSWDAGKVTTEPTCTTAGVKTYTCSACGETKTESVPSLGHDYTLSGTTYICGNCGDSYDTWFVSFRVPSGVPAVEKMEYVAGGIKLPEAGVPTGEYTYKFLGWTTDVVDNAVEAPVIYKADDVFKTDVSVTLYALYGYSIGGSGSAEYVLTDLADITETDTVVITMSLNGTVYALSSANGTSKAPGGDTVTVSGDKLVGEPADALKWNVGGSENAYIFYVAADHTKTLYCTNTNNGVRVGTNTANTFKIASDYLQHNGTNRYVGVYTGNPDWRCYTSTSVNIGGQTLGFYVKGTSGTAYYTTVIGTECTHPEEHVETVDPTCTEDGSVTVTCNDCGETISTDVIPALGHNYESEVTPPAVGAQGYTTHTCTVCGDSYVDSYVDALPEPVAPPTALKINGVNLALMSDLKINFYVPTAAMETYENVYFVLNVADREVIVSEGKDVGDKYQFALTGMPPRMMNDTIDIKLYGTYDGVVYEYTNTYKIADYCYNQIRKASNAATVKTMLVDLLNFGAAHQVYGNHNVENLVNATLTDEEKALASSYEQSFTSVFGQTGTSNGASFRGASLVLSDAIVIRYTVQCDDLTDVTFRATVDGVTHVIDASEFQLVAGTTNRYTIDLNKLTARQMSETVAATVYRGEEAISKTATYSIESYAAGKDINDGSALGNLVKYMMYYGYACVANQAG